MLTKEILKRILLFVMGIIFSQMSFSQENFVPGYVVKNNNDTVFGFVDYQNRRHNPDVVHFRETPGDATVSFRPLDIREFRIEDEIYESAIVDAEISSTLTDQLESDPRLTMRVDTTFLQTLFRGEKSLYYYRNAGGRENFYIKQDGAFELLVYRRYRVVREDNRAVRDNKSLISSRENNRYIGQLAHYLSDCTTLSGQMTNLSYNRKSLSRLFQHYYECTAAPVEFQIEKTPLKVNFGVLAGGTVTSLAFSGSDFRLYLVDGSYEPSIDFTAGLFLDLIIPISQQKWSIYNELLFTSYHFKGSYEGSVNQVPYRTTFDLGFSYLKVNTMLRFRLPVRSVDLFFNGGISNGFVLNSVNESKQVFLTEIPLPDREEPAIEEPREYEQGFVMGTGVRRGPFSLEYRFERGNGMSDFVSLKSVTYRHFLLLGYTF